MLANARFYANLRSTHIVSIRQRICIASFAIAALASAPTVVYSEPASTDADAQQRFFAALRTISMSEDQRGVIRDIIGDGYLSGRTDREIDGRITAVLDAQQAQRLQNLLGYDPTFNVPPPDFRARFFGVVHKFAGNALTLTSGRTIFLSDSTAFYPYRTALQPGIRVGIAGQRTGDGNVNAAGVVAFDEASTVDFDSTSVTAGGRFGTIVSMTKSSIRLADGKTVFLRDDTIFAPNRSALAQGAKILIYGVAAGDGNINADRVEIP